MTITAESKTKPETFRVGQRVVATDDYYDRLTVGNLYEVLSIDVGFDPDFDGDVIFVNVNGGRKEGAYARRFRSLQVGDRVVLDVKTYGEGVADKWNGEGTIAELNGNGSYGITVERLGPGKAPGYFADGDIASLVPVNDDLADWEGELLAPELKTPEVGDRVLYDGGTTNLNTKRDDLGRRGIIASIESGGVWGAVHFEGDPAPSVGYRLTNFTVIPHEPKLKASDLRGGDRVVVDYKVNSVAAKRMWDGPATVVGVGGNSVVVKLDHGPEGSFRITDIELPYDPTETGPSSYLGLDLPTYGRPLTQDEVETIANQPWESVIPEDELGNVIASLFKTIYNLRETDSLPTVDDYEGLRSLGEGAVIRSTMTGMVVGLKGGKWRTLGNVEDFSPILSMVVGAQRVPFEVLDAGI